MAVATDPVLLIDLDGVLVFEAEPPAVEQRELLLLHADLLGQLAAISARKFILTHRSRREATAILGALNLAAPIVEDCYAAEDLFGAAWREGGVRGLFQGGLRKSAIIAAVERRVGAARTQFAFIDDNPINVDGMLAHGIGLGMLAPIRVDDAGLTSFSWRSVGESFAKWRDGGQRGLVRLPERTLPIEPWQRSGIHTRHEGRHVFNVVRVAGRKVRGMLRGVS